MISEERMDKMYDYLEPAINELMTRMLVIGNDSAFAATVCALITQYCEENKLDVEYISTILHNTLIDYSKNGMEE